MSYRAPNDWENLTVMHRNREPAHATLMPFPDAESARSGERSTSPFFSSPERHVGLPLPRFPGRSAVEVS